MRLFSRRLVYCIRYSAVMQLSGQRLRLQGHITRTSNCRLDFIQESAGIYGQGNPLNIWKSAFSAVSDSMIAAMAVVVPVVDLGCWMDYP